MLATLGLAGLLARARQVMTGPAAAAVAVTIAAIILVGGVALGAAWLRGDAASDARAAAEAVCEADKLQAALDAERAKTAALEAAQRARDETIAHLQEQRRLDNDMLSELETERANAIEDARKWEAAAGRGSVVFRADDPWLRKGATAAGAGGAAGR